MKMFIRGVAVLGGAAMIVGGGGAAIAADAQGTATSVGSCTGAQLKIGTGEGQGGAGHGGFPLEFRNTSGHACTLSGYPGLDAISKKGTVLVHAERTESGYLAGAPAGRTVTVQPGQYASAFVEWVDMDSHGGACKNSHSIAVTAPNTYRTVHRAIHVGRCELQVHPVTAGRSGSQPILSGYAAARKAWIHSSKVSAAEQNRYLYRAARDLDSAKHDHSTQAHQLRELAALPLTSETKKQMRKAHHLVHELDAFFHTPKLYN